MMMTYSPGPNAASLPAERLYAVLSDGGQVLMKMEKTFFAHRFAMLRDRFGTSWMLPHEVPSAARAPV